MAEFQNYPQTFHVSASIEGLLSLSNTKLSNMFDRSGKKIRAELKERLAKGEKLIGSAGCEGFCPINGCPGHPVKEEGDAN